MADLHKTLLLNQEPEEAKDLYNGDFASVFAKDAIRPVITVPADQNYAQNIKEAAAHSIKNTSDLLLAAISALHLYIQSNFTGPRLSKQDPIEYTILSTDNEKLPQEFNAQCIEQLARDGEQSFKLQSYPHLLLLAESILSVLVEQEGTSSELKPYCRWWYSRVLAIHQSTLTDDSSTLHDLIFDNLKNDTLLAILGSNETKPEVARALTVRYHCEVARAQLLYDMDSQADKSLDLAQKMSQLKYTLTGMKGRRTKYQIRDAAILVLIAKSAQEKTELEQDPEGADMPSALELNSDMMLEKPSYTLDGDNEEQVQEQDQDKKSMPEELKDIDPNNQPALQDLDTSIILLRAAKIRQSNPHKNPLIQEELTAMANRIIHSPVSSINWCLFSRALWFRSLLEADSSKTAERGTLQIQSLVEELGHTSSRYFPQTPEDQDSKDIGSVPNRMKFIHQLLPLPKWKMDTELAERFMAFGAIKSALEVYERLELWPEVALCHAGVGQETESLEVLDKYLDQHPTDARAWAIKGDITLDPQYWQKSWDIGRYAAAKRSLGRYYYNPPRSHRGVERNLDLAIKHLNDSLQVNPLNHGAWFLYGCAGLETEQFELAAEAFSRCVAIEEEDAKAWSNLSTALIRTGKKPQAFSALKQAVKSATDSKDWRIWSNYITVAADLNEWSEVVRGLKEIIDIRSGKEGEIAIDVDMIERLVQILVSMELPSDKSLDFFQKSAVDLLTNRVPKLITTDHRLWKLVARTHVWLKQPWAALECYEKGFRIVSQHVEDGDNESYWNEAVEFCGDLTDAYINFGPQEGRIEGSTVCPDWKFKAKSAVRSLIGKGKTLWQDTDGWEKLQELKQEVADS